MTDQEDDRTVAINNTGNMVGRELDGRYRILERLGSGGMGTVFKALHLKLGRPVALKILHPHLIVDSKILSRFENEINVMSALGHPNLITIQDAGKTDEGIPYFVMEYLECESLADRLKGGRIEASRALPIFVQIAEALQHAHEKGVIHRDLKPANILLIRRSEGREAGDFVKVVDLGIAKCLSAGDVSAQKQLTQTGEVFGSPQYMAPEQCLGKPQDARTDVYAFGCVMFEVLCGAPPIVRETALETIFAHVNDKPMSFEDAGLAGEKECDRLERIVMRCLAKAPEDRFASMTEVLTALNDRRSGHSPPPPSRPLSVEVAKPGSNARSGPAHAENRYKPVIILSSLAVVGLLLLVALAGLGLAWTQLQRGPAAPPSPTASTMPAITAIPAISPAPPFNPGQQTVIEFEKVAGENAAVKVVSEYNGKPTGEFVDLIKGETEVDVGYSEEPVILVVNAYQPTTWTIKRRNPSVRIMKVLAVGYYPQTVRGVPESQVESVYYEFLNADASHSERRTHENPFDFFYFLFGDNPEKDSEFKKMKESLYQHTGCHIRTFKGARSTDRFEVD